MDVATPWLYFPTLPIFYKDFAATQHFYQQRSCCILVGKRIIKLLKQRSCDILFFFNFNRTIVIKYNEFNFGNDKLNV